MKKISAIEKVYVADRKAWRKWLAKNHAKSKGIWLVFDKKTAREDRLKYGDAVEEALCFGWIDSTLNPIDHAQYMQLFTPRKPKSGWSKLNKDPVARQNELVINNKTRIVLGNRLGSRANTFFFRFDHTLFRFTGLVIFLF